MVNRSISDRPHPSSGQVLALASLALQGMIDMQLQPGSAESTRLGAKPLGTRREGQVEV